MSKLAGYGEVKGEGVKVEGVKGWRGEGGGGEGVGGGGVKGGWKGEGGRPSECSFRFVQIRWKIVEAVENVQF